MSIKEEISAVPINSMGASSSANANSPIATYDPLLKIKKGKKLREIVKRKI